MNVYTYLENILSVWYRIELTIPETEISGENNFNPMWISICRAFLCRHPTFFHFMPDFFSPFQFICLNSEGQKIVSQTFQMAEKKTKLWIEKNLKRIQLLFGCTNISISKKLFAIEKKLPIDFSEMYGSVYQSDLLLNWLTNPKKIGKAFDLFAFFFLIP